MNRISEDKTVCLDDNNEIGVSVIICCYNSASRLPDTLYHIASQHLVPGLRIELILVDNASTDDTSKIARAQWCKYNTKIDFSILVQPIPGLANARVMGLENAKYEYILFCDDDNHFLDNYIQVGVELLQSMPEVGIVGGLPLPKLEFYPGKWIEEVYSAMAIGPRASHSGYVDWVFGAGMFVRKEIYRKLNNSNIKFFLTGRVGKKQTSGEDSELCLLVQLLGYKIYYSDRLQLNHFMQKHRLVKSFFRKNMYDKVEATYYLYKLDAFVNRKTQVGFTFMLLNGLLYSFPRTIWGKFRFFNQVNIIYIMNALTWRIINIKKVKLINRYILDLK